MRKRAERPVRVVAPEWMCLHVLLYSPECTNPYRCFASIFVLVNTFMSIHLDSNNIEDV